LPEIAAGGKQKTHPKSQMGCDYYFLWGHNIIFAPEGVYENDDDAC
jgi:selenocysteine lyase/cysteine desulfurase